MRRWHGDYERKDVVNKRVERLRIKNMYQDESENTLETF